MLTHSPEFMHFTLIFDRRPDGPSLIYELVYHSAPIWVVPERYGDTDYQYVIQPEQYKLRGAVRVLLDSEGFEADSLRSPNVGVICHENDSGQGTEDDLNDLLDDLKSEGFTPRILHHN